MPILLDRIASKSILREVPIVKAYPDGINVIAPGSPVGNISREKHANPCCMHGWLTGTLRREYRDCAKPHLRWHRSGLTELEPGSLIHEVAMNGWSRFRMTLSKIELAASQLPLLAGRIAIAFCIALFLATPVAAQEAEWIWSPEHSKENVPPGATVYFRKTFTVRDPEQAAISIAADDTYELFLNGRRVAEGESTRKMGEHDLSKFIGRGPNVVGVRVTNVTGNTAAVAARVTVKERNGNWVSYSTDETWRTADSALPLWNTGLYNDRAWKGAQVFGQLGDTAPWDRREDVPSDEVHRSERFQIASDFEVERVPLKGEEIGSLIAMAFNEFGQIIASREGGPLLLLHDTDNDRSLDSAKIYCDKVTSCQGILALNGDVYVTGEGPDGLALYRLSDKDRDGLLEDVRTLLRFECTVAEHGPHAIVLGPDGLIYVLLGNHAKLAGEYDKGSPHRDPYDTELLTPKYEDPGGHAAGIKAPGGTIIRTDAEGSAVHVVAGGLRNPYDFCFNREGEMFVHDADMESDEGMTWYRPTRMYHVVPGGEYGWRSGWSKWPDYFVDTLPGLLDTGRGSPTGIVTYNHYAFPARYHGAIFAADWAQGRILAVKLKRNGASYTASADVFLSGNPLNVTDLEVGPDGHLYFITGGRGTSGGVYRVKWRGQVPKEVSNIGTGLSAVVRQPQLHSSYARQNLASLKQELGDSWNSSLAGIARSASNPPQYRLQALELMQLFGPPPSADLLIRLSREPNEQVKTRATELMGMHPTEEIVVRLIELLDDSDRNVRRKACEALSRADRAPPIEKLTKLLASDDPFEAWAARRLLERMDPELWREMVLKTNDHRLLIQGGLALMIAYPEKRNALDLLENVSRQMKGYISDSNFIDMLRLTEVALVRGGVLPEEVPGLRRQLSAEFPAGDPLMNRELIRLLVFMQDADTTERYLSYLESDAADIDKLHVAMHLRFLNAGWTPEQKMQLLKFFENANRREGGSSYARYVINATRDFVKTFSDEEAQMVLAQGAQLPNAALGALYRLPAQLDEDQLSVLKTLDGQLTEKDNESYQRLKVGIVAVLARSGDPESMAYLRQVWEEDPERRQPVALGLSLSPAGENWPYLIRSLPNLEIAAAREVLNKLATVPQAPEEADPYRQVILLGLKMKEKGSEPAIRLLAYWTGTELAIGQPVDEQMKAWQKWFAETYPDLPEATLPTASETAKYSYDEIIAYLGSDEAAKSSRARGLNVFVKANCAKCHRHGDRGESMGPDLSTVSSRFTRKELLESIVYPSHVISSQYAAKTVLTTDGQTITGIVAPGAAGETVILKSDGEKIVLQSEEIEEMKPSKVSAMPEGLLDTLTIEEIADLFALLEAKDKPGLTRRPIIREAIK